MARIANALHIIKSNWLAINMIAGITGYQWLTHLQPLLPYLLFTMLFLTFLTIDPKKISFRHWFSWALIAQYVGGLVCFLILNWLFDKSNFFHPYHDMLSQGLTLCILMPTATASPIVCRKIGGDIYSVSSYLILSSIIATFFLPLFFSMANPSASISISQSFLTICKRTVSVLFFPLIAAFVIRTIYACLKNKYAMKIKLTPNFYANIAGLPFYIWGGTVILLSAGVTDKLVNDTYSPVELFAISLLTVLICISLFSVGRWMGQYHLSKQSKSNTGETIASTQAFGQKNTTLGIWLAQLYLAPFAFIAPAVYMLCQNIINNQKIKNSTKKPLEIKQKGITLSYEE